MLNYLLPEGEARDCAQKGKTREARHVSRAFFLTSAYTSQDCEKEAAWYMDLCKTAGSTERGDLDDLIFCDTEYEVSRR